MGINLPFISKYDIVVKLFVASHVKTIMRYFEEYKNKSHSTMVEYVRLSEVSFKKSVYPLCCSRLCSVVKQLYSVKQFLGGGVQENSLFPLARKPDCL